ncbi:MAG: prepilin-type N-terminal cleavage/methylation domain-containing protein [Verrucomicrobiota bacterium]
MRTCHHIAQGSRQSQAADKSAIRNPQSAIFGLRRACLAFTLVEIMLAMGIFAFVMASIYSSWTSVIRGSMAAQKAAIAAQRSRVAVRAIEDAILTAQVFEANPQHYWFVADTKGEFATLSLVARLPESFPGSGMYGDQMLRHVSITVEPDNEGGNKLMLRQWPLLMPVDRGGADAKPYEIVLGRSVDLFKMEFWDNDKKDWMDEWPASKTNSLPLLVRVAVGMGNGPMVPMSEREIATRIIAPVATKVPLGYQIPGAPNQPPGVPPGMPPPPPPGRIMR